MVRLGNLTVDNKKILDIYAILESISEGTTSNGDPYINMILKDRSSKVNGKMWNKSLSGIDSDINQGKIVKIRCKIDEYQGKKQLIVEKIRLIRSEDNILIEDFIEKAPIEALKMYEYIMSVVEDFDNTYLKYIVTTVLEDNKEKLLYYPASKIVHHDIYSGLMYHIYRMLKNAEKLVDIYDGVYKDLLFAGIILHDIGKLRELNANNLALVEDYTKEGSLLGHMIQGIKMINKVCEQLSVPEEICLMLEHIIASHHGREEYGAIKKPMILEAELVHHLDMIDSRIYQFNKKIKDIDVGEFSERELFLDKRQIYKHNIFKEKEYGV